jgi:hypothetical protein
MKTVLAVMLILLSPPHTACAQHSPPRVPPPQPWTPPPPPDIPAPFIPDAETGCKAEVKAMADMLLRQSVIITDLKAVAENHADHQ